MTGAGPARVVLEQPEQPTFLVVLTHGAGGAPDTVDLIAVRDAAQRLGAATALVTQPYRVRGAAAPGSAPKQDAAWAELIAVLRKETAQDGAVLPLILPLPAGQVRAAGVALGQHGVEAGQPRGPRGVERGFDDLVGPRMMRHHVFPQAQLE